MPLTIGLLLSDILTLRLGAEKVAPNLSKVHTKIDLPNGYRQILRMMASHKLAPVRILKVILHKNSKCGDQDEALTATFTE
ncbi:hypothetical protein LJC09_03695 [Desulfovibrio sp. OttesenSCG-928-F20]|nr:hypothetical protein [Desulfovibrio sp. OttesenSCG-928-F20]